jgi:hypothetical protein
METEGNQIQQNSAKKYLCNFCDYTTSRKCNFDTHLISLRHVRNSAKCTKETKIQQKFSNKTNQTICRYCKKQFKHRSGLWKHNKICKQNNYNNEQINDNNNEIKNDNKEKDDIINILLKQNSELMDIIKNGTNNTYNTYNTNNTNSHNKAFNLNFFLNETCKNAMNITDFIDSIKLQLSDLMDVGEVGYVEGISKIIVNKLNSLDETIRPIHCTDKKREIIYIKDEGQWEKDDDNKSKLRKSIRKVSDKNMKLLQVFREKYPDCREAKSIYCNKYCKMVIEAMGGMGYTTIQQEEKIIRNISKATTIKKDTT